VGTRDRDARELAAIVDAGRRALPGSVGPRPRAIISAESLEIRSALSASRPPGTTRHDPDHQVRTTGSPAPRPRDPDRSQSTWVCSRPTASSLE
jgi:hypothetical protein